MDELKEMQARLRVLEDIEAIRKLKARYWFSVDRKRWDEFGDCFTEDAEIGLKEKDSAIVGVPPVGHLKGRKEIVEIISNRCESLLTVHQGYHADIEITSERTAKAIWAVYDNIQNMKSNIKMEGYGFYEDEFAKANGRWQIKNSKVTRFFVQSQRIDVG